VKAAVYLWSHARVSGGQNTLGCWTVLECDHHLPCRELTNKESNNLMRRFTKNSRKVRHVATNEANRDRESGDCYSLNYHRPIDPGRFMPSGPCVISFSRGPVGFFEKKLNLEGIGF